MGQDVTPEEQRAKVQAAFDRMRKQRAADTKARAKARRGTKHAPGTTKSKPTADQRAARRRQAAKSRRNNR